MFLMLFDPVFLAYFLLQIGAGYGTYRLMKSGGIRTRFQFGFAAFAIASTTTLTSVGPIGLILGLPSIVITSILVACLLYRKEEP